ncbi:MAG: histidine ammonia-lyase [Mycobacteriales bacterium]|nr:MAG: histidine ammonia-lyase [Pseudonocardiales bacterium]
MTTIVIGADGVSPAEVLAVARGSVALALTDDAIAAIERSRAIVDAIEDGDRAVYGVSTGFGALASTPVPRERRTELQEALIRSHAAGTGDPMPREVVRAMLMLRVRSLAMGYSGVRPLVVHALVELLNNDITPWVPQHGSLGASGDLAPLAHCAIVALGDGWVLGSDGERVTGADALSAAGLSPITLSSKEGLALINGTDGMLGMLLLACADARHLLTMADVTAALAIEAMLGSERPFDPALHRIRPHPGQVASAANIRALLQNSGVMDSHRDDMTHAVQDAYSMRCAPQVAGAARDTLGFADQVAARELKSIVDNPVVLPDGRVETTGNFHGAPLGFAADYLAIAIAEVGSIAERRIDRLLDVTRSRGLPAFLAPDPGVNSGLMIAQYTAAALVADNRRLAAPASVDSLPTSGMQEDHVSMGWSATVKLRTVLDNVRRVLAVELLAAARGLALREPLAPSPAGAVAVRRIVAAGGAPGPDTFVAPVLEAAVEMVGDTAFRAEIEAAVGTLR